MSNWVYRGDMNVECGGYWVLDEGDEDFVRIVECVPCSDAGGPDNLFVIERGSLYMPTERARRATALETLGYILNDDDSVTDCTGATATPEEARIYLIEGFKAYHGIDRDTFGGETVLRVGGVDKGWGGNGWNPEPDTVLRSNVKLRRYIEDNFL